MLIFAKHLKESLADIYKSRFLAKQLAVKDIKAQYRQSYLRILWAFIAPFIPLHCMDFLSHTGTIRLTDTGVPYAVLAFSVTLMVYY